MNHYFTNSDVKSNIKEKKIIVNNIELTFLTDNGVFSKRGLDFGTRLLLESIPISEIKGDVLDFGCGYGPIGIYIKKTTSANVDMVDINRRSLKLTEKNALLNKVIVNAFESDIYDKVDKKYDYIISNPPIRVGKEILYKILFDAKKHLVKGGQLWIVINKDQGAKSVLKDLQNEYDAQLITKNKGFYIICSVNN